MNDMNDRGTNQRDAVYVYGSCDLCNVDERVLIYDAGANLVCAEHMRQLIKANPRSQKCDNCEYRGPVFREAGHRRNEYLCLTCHQVNGVRVHHSTSTRVLQELLVEINAGMRNSNDTR
jgi:hypothetical protein